jgi:cysteine desulfurase/selenocysteine lyase
MSIEYFKSQFTNDKTRLHLNNAGLSPISKPARDKVIYWANRFFEEGFYTDLDYMNDVLSSRTSIAKLLECDHSEISFYQSTAYAISQLCFHFPLNENDEVIMWDQEYSSNLYPWQEACKRKKAKLILASSNSFQTPTENLLKHVSEKTKVIAISWIQFQTGAMSDLKTIGEFCLNKNIFFFVDIMQGIGLHPFSMKKFHIDACASGSHKWLVSPVGVGFLALDKKHTKMLVPHNVGASTFGTCDDPSDLLCLPKTDSLKFEAGSKQVLEITALGASVELLLQTGIEQIEKEVLRLSSMLSNGLIDRGFDVIHNQTSIVNFIPKKDTEEKLKKIPCLFAKRGPGFRLSPHAHNSDEDIERVLKALNA